MMEWLCIGDSITERNFRTSLNYHDYVAPRLGLEVLNEGFSGTGFLRDFEGNVNYLKRLRMIEPKPGIVTVMGRRLLFWARNTEEPESNRAIKGKDREV